MSKPRQHRCVLALQVEEGSWSVGVYVYIALQLQLGNRFCNVINDQQSGIGRSSRSKEKDKDRRSFVPYTVDFGRKVSRHFPKRYVFKRRVFSFPRTKRENAGRWKKGPEKQKKKKKSSRLHATESENRLPVWRLNRHPVPRAPGLVRFKLFVTGLTLAFYSSRFVVAASIEECRTSSSFTPQVPVLRQPLGDTPPRKRSRQRKRVHVWCIQCGLGPERRD